MFRLDSEGVILRLKFKIGDIFIVILILLTAVLTSVKSLQGNYSTKIAVISQNNTVLQRISLNDHSSESLYIDYDGKYPGTIEVNGGKVRFHQAECPDQVCVETGWISKPGQIAVCLPAGVIIKIEGENDEFDLMVK